MWVVAIEASTRSSSVALWHTSEAESTVVGIPPTTPIAKWLIPSLQQLLRQRCIEPGQLGLVAVTRGPGAFTGLRVGLTAAKTLAFSQQIPLIGLSTLHVLAEQTPPELVHQDVWTLMDAQRGEWIAGRWRHQAAGWQLTGSVRRLAHADWLANWRPGEVVMACGRCTGVDWPPDGAMVPSAQAVPQAATVARLAMTQFDPRQPASATWHVTPDYHRRSAAEEKRAR